MTLHILTAFAMLLYAGATLSMVMQLLRPAASRQPALWLAAAGILLSAYVLSRLIFFRHGMDLGIFNTVALVGWTMAAIAWFTLWRGPLRNLGLLLFPVGGISLLLARLFPADRLMVPDGGWALDAHIVISLLAYSILAVAALQSLLLAWQDYQLRRGLTTGMLVNLPPLQVMEHFLFQMITAGFALLSLALFSGFLFVHNLMEQHLIHKTVLSILAWLVFAILLWGRWHFGWRGRRAIRWTLAGFIVLMLAYFGSKLVLELILGRHWRLMS